MKNRPTPIVVVTDRPRVEGVDMTFASLSRGALDLLPKATSWRPGTVEANALLARLKELARSVAAVASPPAGQPKARTRPSSWAPRLLALGASTGGPTALATVLGALPKAFPLPVVLVQHMDPLFHDSFALWLGKKSPLRVRLAVDGDALVAGQVLVAPSGWELVVRSDSKVKLKRAVDGTLHVPSVNTLFHSVAEAFGARAIGVLLTGMGADGAAGLKAMHSEGALTVAQDRKSSVIYGMPAAAVELNAAEQQLALAEIGPFLVKNAAGSAVAPDRTPASAGASGDFQMAKAKILMVDDSPVILEAGRMALEEAGYEVLTLENPLTVPGVVRREKPDLVLIDVNMPAVNGDSVIQIVNTHGLASKAPVILYSDIPERELELRAKKCGAAGYIRKTGDDEALVAQVKRFLDGR